MDLAQVGQLCEGMLVSERNEEHAVVGQGRENGVDGHFLSSSEGTGGNEGTGVLATEGTLGPEATSGIPEGLWEIHVSASVILSDGRRGKSGITFH